MADRWADLSDSEVKARLVNRGVDLRVAETLLGCARRGCEGCARQVGETLAR